MTWGEIQIESLKKMFLNKENLTVENLSTYLTNKDYKTYLFAMPQACNEAINYITSALGCDESVDTLTKDDSEIYDLSEILDSFKKIKRVICPTGVSWEHLTSNIIRIYGWNRGEVKVVYEVKPSVVSSTTLSNEKLGIRDEYSQIIPLYIASELYKDDDLSLATMYMNEFMNMINLFQNEDNYISNPMIESIYTM